MSSSERTFSKPPSSAESPATAAFDLAAARNTLATVTTALAKEVVVAPDHPLVIELRSLYRRVLKRLQLPTIYSRSMRHAESPAGLTLEEKRALNYFAVELEKVLHQYDSSADRASSRPAWRRLLARILQHISPQPTLDLEQSSAHGSVSSVVANPSLAIQAMRAARR